MLNHQIAEVFSITILKLILSDIAYPSLVLTVSNHLLTMRLLKPCTRHATELDALQGYLCYRCLILLLLFFKVTELANFC